MAAELLEFALERVRRERADGRREPELLGKGAEGGNGASAPGVRRARQARRVHAIEGLISPQLGIGSEELSFAFELLSKGTEAEGAKLDFTVSAAAIRCNSCGAQRAANQGETGASAPCPACGAQAKIEPVRGLEVTGFETG
jgi:Zn finger protein HypA/HybF involved in hydrogenase expression